MSDQNLNDAVEPRGEGVESVDDELDIVGGADEDLDEAGAADADEAAEDDAPLAEDDAETEDADGVEDTVSGESADSAEDTADTEEAGADEAEAAEEEPAEPAEPVDPVQALRDELRSLPGEWYVIHTYAGYENRVKTNLEQRAVSLNVEDYIFQAEVPQEEVVQIKNGDRKTIKQNKL
ncbi:transcription termination/antitermination NusG family protein, partial [Streptomyces albogriseolus]